MIYITGDTHANFGRFSNKLFKAGGDDTVIICGDFGGIWENSSRERYWLDWLSDKPYKILWVDGNHENYDILNHYPVETWNGGNIHRIRKNVIHLMRGQVFTIENKKIFTMGGARSHDISGGILDIFAPDWKEQRKKMEASNLPYRIDHISWWKEEIPSEKEMKEGLENLQKNNYVVDYIVTHDCPTSILNLMSHGKFKSDFLNDYLEEVRVSCKFSKWFFGHYHDNKIIDGEGRFQLLYENIVSI